jgi:hypothetical protein
MDASGSLSGYGGSGSSSDGSVFGTGTTAFNDYGGGGSYDMAAGDSYYAGAYATGGSFTVPGSGGIDTTLVTMHATAGETVSVQPPGASSGSGGQPIININVTGVSDAQSFIKSEAPIEAAILRAVKRAQARL